MTSLRLRHVLLLANLGLAACGGARPTAPSPTTPDDGACVDPVASVAARAGATSATDITVHSLDLDGTGPEDIAIVEPGSCKGDDCVQAMYVMQATCGVYVGDAFGHALAAASLPPVAGLKRLRIDRNTGDGAWSVTTLAFDGAAYQAEVVEHCAPAPDQLAVTCQQDVDDEAHN